MRVEAPHAMMLEPGAPLALHARIGRGEKAKAVSGEASTLDSARTLPVIRHFPIDASVMPTVNGNYEKKRKMYVPKPVQQCYNTLTTRARR